MTGRVVVLLLFLVVLGDETVEAVLEFPVNLLTFEDYFSPGHVGYPPQLDEA